MHRFFVPPECIAGDSVTLPQPLARQLARVLRLARGDSIMVLDNRGWQYQVKLAELSDTAASGQVVARTEAPPEPSIDIYLYQALLKADKFELVLQKGTEIGVSHFVPVKYRRSEGGMDVGAAKLERWRRILTEAAEQSGRGHLPELAAPLTLAQACEAEHDPSRASFGKLRTPPQADSLGIAPEYEDCRRLAREHKLPLQQVYRTVESEARQKLLGR